MNYFSVRAKIQHFSKPCKHLALFYISLFFPSYREAETQRSCRQDCLVSLLLCNGIGHPPKLSYMIDSGSTPSESSICTTAFDIGPGPHM